MVAATSTALVRSNSVSLVRSYDEARSFAKAYALTGFGGRGDQAVKAAEALVKMEAGAELGFGPMGSIQAFHVVEGKPTLSGNGWAALIRRSERYDYSIKRLDPEACELQFYVDGKEDWLCTFTIEDAKRANLLRNNVWQRYPEDMLFNRCITKGCRKVCPEVGMGLPIYTPEDLGASVDVVDGEMVVVGNEPSPTAERTASVEELTVPQEQQKPHTEEPHVELDPQYEAVNEADPAADEEPPVDEWPAPADDEKEERPFMQQMRKPPAGKRSLAQLMLDYLESIDGAEDVLQLEDMTKERPTAFKGDWARRLTTYEQMRRFALEGETFSASDQEADDLARIKELRELKGGKGA